MHWEDLYRDTSVVVRRHGRFLRADLETPHRVISTSVRNGGQAEHVRVLINHQSCEGAGHDARFAVITGGGQEAYHDLVCAEVGVPPAEAVVMGTAANMHYAAIASEQDHDLTVTAVVTAGVQTNAVCAGDPAHWRETGDGIAKVAAVAGTINTMLLVNTPLTAAALARSTVTMVEGKSAALARLAVPSCYSQDLATGTGTDQFAIAAPLEGKVVLTSASPHMKLGELIGRATRRATVEALRWQNGLEASYTRGLFHALSRYGLREQTVFDDIAPLLAPSDLELLRRNSKAAFYEPLVGAAAHALAAVLDRIRHQMLPDTVSVDAVVQQAATLAVGLAARPDRWAEFRSQLHSATVTSDAGPQAVTAQPKDLVLRAIALGWSEKWRAN